MAGDESVRPDRWHEISRLQQTMHDGRSACRRSSAAAETGSRFAAARRRTGREAIRRPRRHGGPHRACGAEWKSVKAEGKVPAGQKWPQFWSECNKRKKAEGM